MTSITNKQRAKNASTALDLYEGDTADQVKDLLADLMHFCNQTSIDFDPCIDSAKESFNAEI